ncbi:MAG: hypothetical protein ACI3XR_02485 [Eubacteriales bacterium]
MKKICIWLLSLLCLLSLLTGCGKGFKQGGVSSGTTTEPAYVMTPEEEMQGYWFSPEELLIYYFAEGGKCVLYEMSSPTSVKSKIEGSYVLDGDRIAMTVGDKTSSGRMTTDGKSALILTLDGIEHILTPTNKPES